ncbi:HD domain-containing protein [Variovorax sp. J22P168]|uniref:phosphonate degradation HD-domain oxygenase n=1 Tax=Variovorax jilinensis TaxID=3053513 RepID=UPI0025754105|nr:phosphonate degradation HD-domain oxygenase [Variovorax sp. J22P168]MDM0013356.1 HD domain-containing protein [Variovorax sp. J22P168]
MSLTLSDIQTLFERRGGEQYSGEPVTQLQHALQTAQRAEQEDADDELVTAALLHDLGHLLNDQGESPTLRGIDDLHQYFALPFLRGVFGERLLCAIKWHVDAKRYLCATQPAYWQSLSDDSKRSLELQGGVFPTAEAERFMSQPHAAEAVRLRVWDDLAKEAGRPTPPLSHYLARAWRCLRA